MGTRRTLHQLGFPRPVLNGYGGGDGDEICGQVWGWERDIGPEPATLLSLNTSGRTLVINHFNMLNK